MQFPATFTAIIEYALALLQIAIQHVDPLAGKAEPGAAIHPRSPLTDLCEDWRRVGRQRRHDCIEARRHRRLRLVVEQHQVHVGCAGGMATRKRATQRDRGDIWFTAQRSDDSLRE